MFEKYRAAYRRIRSHSQFTDAPHQRIKTLILSLASDPTLPNATAAGALVTGIGAWIGYIPPLGFYTNLLALLVTVFIYAIGDEVRIALEAIAAEDAQTDDSDRPGIE